MNATDFKMQFKNRFRIISRKSLSSPDNELIYAEGKNKEEFKKLQIRMGKSEEEMHRIIAALNTSL